MTRAGVIAVLDCTPKVSMAVAIVTCLAQSGTLVPASINLENSCVLVQDIG